MAEIVDRQQPGTRCCAQHCCLTAKLSSKMTSGNAHGIVLFLVALYRFSDATLVLLESDHVRIGSVLIQEVINFSRLPTLQFTTTHTT